MKTDDGKRFYSITTQIHDAMMQYEYEDKKNHKLGRVESNLLHFLAIEKKAFSMKDIASALSVSHSRVTHLIDSLLAKGYLVRIPSSDDRRIYLAQITTEGINAVSNYKDRTIQKYNDLLTELPETERHFILDSLTKWKAFLAERKKEISKKSEDT